MSKSGDTFWDTAIHRRALQRWALCAREATTAKISVLKRQATRARLLRDHLDRLIRTADERLALPVIGSTGFPRPHNADWAWRPELWRTALPVKGISSVKSKSMLGDEITLFHDCARSEITLRQLRNIREQDLAPYGLRIDVFRFDGSFMSRSNTLVVPGGSMSYAMGVICTPLVHRLVEMKRKGKKQMHV